jgi:uncharacterized protein YbaP (TraB family)
MARGYTQRIKCSTLAALHIEPPGTENTSSIADTPNNRVYLLGTVHVVNLICRPQTQVVQ